MNFFDILSTIIAALGGIYVAVIIFDGIYDAVSSAVHNRRKAKEGIT